MNSYRQMYMVNQDQYNILQKISNPPAQVLPTMPSITSQLSMTLLKSITMETPITEQPIPSDVIERSEQSRDWVSERLEIAQSRDRPLVQSTIAHKFPCPTCNKSFSSSKNLKYHKRIHKKAKCEIDNREFDNQNILAHHMKKQHIDGFKCNICNDIKESQSELNKHLKTHAKSKKKSKKPRNLLIINPEKWEKL